MQREEADLYGLPLDEFIPARTELEKRLRKEGERERAAAVKKLPKPSVAAWGVNQASRTQPRARRALLDASAELRDVQERLIAREASAADLEAVAARQRAAIDELVDAASGLLTSDGKGLGDATLVRVRETFAAVASDPELAELVEAGTVDRERQPAGLGFPLAAAEAAPSPAKPAKGSAKRGSPAPSKESGKPPKESAKERKRREKEAKRRERELRGARDAVKAAKAAERDAAKRRKAAEREAEKAARELERAERAASDAREAAEAARAELDAAEATAAAATETREAAESDLERLG